MKQCFVAKNHMNSLGFQKSSFPVVQLCGLINTQYPVLNQHFVCWYLIQHYSESTVFTKKKPHNRLYGCRNHSLISVISADTRRCLWLFCLVGATMNLLGSLPIVVMFLMATDHENARNIWLMKSTCSQRWPVGIVRVGPTETSETTVQLVAVRQVLSVGTCMMFNGNSAIQHHWWFLK